MKDCDIYNNHTIKSMYKFRKPPRVYYDPDNVDGYREFDIICTTTGPMEGEVPAGNYISAFGESNLREMAHRLGFRVLRSLVVRSNKDSYSDEYCYATPVVLEHQLDELINEQNPSPSYESPTPSSTAPPTPSSTTPPTSSPTPPPTPPPSYTKFAS